MLRVALIFLTQFLLGVMVAQANHALSGWHLYIFAGGLFVAYPALILPLREGLLVSFLGGLFCDASVPLASDLAPLAFALAHRHALLFACAHAIVFQLRDRLPRHETVARVLVALFTNLALYLLFSAVQLTHSLARAEIWPRIIIDLAVSQVFLVLVAPWFFALQGAALSFAGAGRQNLADSP